MKLFSISLRTMLIIFVVSVCAGGCSGSKPGPPTRVSVMTYNIYHGEDANGGSNLDAKPSFKKPGLQTPQSLKPSSRLPAFRLTPEAFDSSPNKQVVIYQSSV